MAEFFTYLKENKDALGALGSLCQCIAVTVAAFGVMLAFRSARLAREHTERLKETERERELIDVESRRLQDLAESVHKAALCMYQILLNPDQAELKNSITGDFMFPVTLQVSHFFPTLKAETEGFSFATLKLLAFMVTHVPRGREGNLSAHIYEALAQKPSLEDPIAYFHAARQALEDKILKIAESHRGGKAVQPQVCAQKSV